MIKNNIGGTGFNLAKEKRDQSKDDWVLGAKTPIGAVDDISGVVTALHAWRSPVRGVYQRTTAQINHCIISYIEKLAKYYPIGEIQRGYEDYLDCVTRGFINEIEKQLNYLVDNRKLSQTTINWLKEKEYFINGRVVLSNRIPAMGSGTSRTGNSLKAVIQWIENNGIHPRLLPEDKKMTWAQYHDKRQVTQKMLDIGIESREYIKINYAKVYSSSFLKLFGNFKWDIFDNYLDYDNDYIKRLAENYIFLSYGYKIIINDAKKKIMLNKQLDKSYNHILHRSPDDGALPYLDFERDFVEEELMKSEERNKIDKILEWAKGSSFWKIFLPSELKGIINEWKKLSGN